MGLHPITSVTPQFMYGILSLALSPPGGLWYTRNNVQKVDIEAKVCP